MRMPSRFGAVLATSALAATMAMGGAGIAQAQGSLGPLTGPLGSTDDAELAVSGDRDSTGGSIANSTADEPERQILAFAAAVMEKWEEAVADGDTIAKAFDRIRAEIDAAVKVGVSVPDVHGP